MTPRADLLFDAPLHPQRIESMYAFIVQDGQGGEAVPAFSHNGMMVPLVGADQARIDSLLEMAQLVARESGKQITLCRFSVREELQVIEP